jgi:sigma-B regulation protein RsbU (phosphoserine phosphatase)
MTAARSFLRMRVNQEGSLADIASDLNRHLFKDVSQTYRFMTFFILALDRSLNKLEWVRAGHDPAMLYEPASDRFHDLEGMGIALGLDEDYAFAAYQKDGFARDQIIVMASDGIFETHNVDGEMFGKDRLRNVIRSSTHLSATTITDRVFDAVTTFTKGTLPDDDRTLVVIKRI